MEIINCRLQNLSPAPTSSLEQLDIFVVTQDVKKKLFTEVIISEAFVFQAHLVQSLKQSAHRWLCTHFLRNLSFFWHACSFFESYLTLTLWTDRWTWPRHSQKDSDAVLFEKAKFDQSISSLQVILGVPFQQLYNNRWSEPLTFMRLCKMLVFHAHRMKCHSIKLFITLCIRCLSEQREMVWVLSCGTQWAAGSSRYAHVCVLVPLSDGEIGAESHFKNVPSQPYSTFDPLTVCACPSLKTGKALRGLFELGWSFWQNRLVCWDIFKHTCTQTWVWGYDLPSNYHWHNCVKMMLH